MLKIHSFFPFLNTFMSFLALNFAAGDGGFLSSFGGDAGGPPVDLGDIDGGDADGGEASEAAGGAEGDGKEGAGAEGDKGKDGAAAATQAGPDLAKPLSSGAKKFLGELKQTDPAAWKEINNRIWSLNGLDKKIAEHFDNGVDDAIALKTNVDTFLKEAGADNLQEIRTELNDFRTTDAKIIKGDPSFINDLPQPAQEAIYRMMPTFVADWQTRDNEGYQRYFGGLVVETLRATKFSQNLEMALWKLEEMGVDDPGVKKVHDLLTGNLKWINDLDTKVKTAPEKKPTNAEDDQVSAREKSVAQGELKLAQTRVLTRWSNQFKPKVLKELKKIAAGADGNIPAHVNKGEVVLRSLQNLARTLGKSVEDRVDQFLRAKDEEGAFSYLSSQASDKRVTEAVTNAYRYLYRSGAAAPRTAAPGGDKGKDGGAGGGENAQAGFITINYDPKASSIDVQKTTALAQKMGLSYRALVSQNKAVLKNGKRVTWPRDAQAEA